MNAHDDLERPDPFRLAEHPNDAHMRVTIADLKAVIVERDTTIKALSEKVRRLELKLAQALAREEQTKTPKGFVSAKKRRKLDDRIAKRAITEARHV